jgi:metallothiol transferase
MRFEIERMISEVESGRLTRRQLLARLTALAAVARGASGMAGPLETPSTFRAVGLNHIALRVTDIPRSRAFYVKHLGLSVSSESAGSCFLNCGPNFVALFRAGEAGLDHYCYSVEDYSVSSAAEKLKAEGLEPRINGDRIYFDDPDGLEVQLSSREHRA